jgi:hypothetical protein
MSISQCQVIDQCDRFRLLPPQPEALPIDIGGEALVEAVLDQQCLVTGQWRIQYERQWLPLAEHPKRPWLDEILRRAVDALRKDDPDQCEFLCRRLLAVARPADQDVTVRHAHFMLGYLEAAGGQWPQAARRLGELVVAPDRFGACVESNLGYVQCLLGHVRLACQHWQSAVRAWPELLPAWLSLQNLAEVMLWEGARNDPQLPAWRALREQVREGLKRISIHEVRRWLHPRAMFPACESMLILPLREYSPPLSTYLPTDDTGEAAGRRLLAEATAALASERVERAELLAARAMSESPKLAADAQQVGGEAARKRVENERLQQAERLCRLLNQFERELAGMTCDHLDAPQDTLQLMTVLVPEATTLEACRRRYQQRVVEICWSAAERTAGAEREAWLIRANSQAST